MIRKSTALILYGDESAAYVNGLSDQVFIAPNAVHVANALLGDTIYRYTLASVT
jgi:hypothetical protein